MKSLVKLSLVVALLAVWAPAAPAATSNWWTNVTTGDFTNGANWSVGAPTATDWVFFTNQTASTVTFSRSVTNGPLVVYDSSPTFDLNGFIWKVNRDTYGAIIGTNTTGAMTLTFSSSASPQVTGGNMIMIGDALNDANLIGSTGGVNGATKIVVDRSKGNGVILQFGGSYALGLSNAQVTVDGSGSEFQVYDTRFGANVTGSILITNDAVFRSAIPSYSWASQLRIGGIKSPATSPYSTVTVANASMVLHGAMIGSDSGSAMVVLRNSTLTSFGSTDPAPFSGGDRDLQVGLYSYWGGGTDNSVYKGDLLVDNSTVNAQSLTLGANWIGNAPGRVQVLNGSTVNLSNQLLVTSYHSATGTNTLVLNNSTLAIGGGSVAGALTNRGIVRAAGTIRGAGSGRLLVRNEAMLEVGSSLGTLVLSNANLQLAAGSQTAFELSATGLDQILVSNGYASVLGTNSFSLTGLSVPTPGVKWGLGVYDFVVATGITYSVQSDNLSNLLASAPYNLTYGIDFRYGLVDLHNGFQALRLEFVPEPSTVWLLVVGDWCFHRWRRRR